MGSAISVEDSATQRERSRTGHAYTFIQNHRSHNGVDVSQRQGSEGQVPVAELATAHHPQVQVLIEALFADDDALVARVVQAFRVEQPGFEALALELLAPAARELGVLWGDDVLDFTQVTLAVTTLQVLLRGASDAPVATSHATVARCALLAAVPGEQHTFGLTIIAEVLRRAGWFVRSGMFASEAAIGAAVRREPFTLVGISVGAAVQLDAARSAIAVVRAHSRNAELVVLAGGPAIVEIPGRAVEIGADAGVTDARDVVGTAERLISLSKGSQKRSYGLLA